MKKKFSLLLIGIAIFFVPQYAYSTFDIIDATRTYIRTIEEYPEIEMRDYSNPDYQSYYEKTDPWLLSKFFEKRGLRTPAFSPLQAKKMLKSITKSRELNGLFGRFVQKITPKEDEKILIFGDLCGAVHSLMRDLEYLKTTNIIGDNFKLKDGYYLIINGNVADKSHHILEILAVIIRLIEENPKKVFYVRGAPEDKENWLGKTLEYELIARARYISKDKIPLETLINRFFNTLPIAVFVTTVTDDKVQYIQFSSDGTQDKELHSSMIETFLQPNIIENHYKINETINFEKKNQKKTEFIALFRAEDRRKTYHASKGIVRLDDEEGIPSFATISGPVESNRRLYDFFYDAFIELTIKKDLSLAAITLFFRDVRELTGFQQETVPFLSRSVPSREIQNEKTEKGNVRKELDVESQPTQAKKSIKLGCTLDLTRALNRVGAQHRRGIQAAINRYEKQENMDIQMTFLDDQYSPDIARTNIETLVQKKIDIILGPVGSSTTERYLDLVKSKQIAVLFPMTGASSFRNPELPYIFNFRASYETEGQILLHEAIEKYHAQKVALFYQDDSFGHAALSGIEMYAKAKNLPEDFIVKIPYERNNVNFAAQEEAIRKSDAQAIILVTVISAARELLRLFDLSFFSGKVVLGVSDLSERTFMNFAKEKGIHIQTLSVTPSPTSDIAIAKRFRQDADAEHIEMDTFAFEGYIDGTICFDALKQIKETTVTKEAICDIFKTYHEYDLFGLKLTFNQEKQDFSQGTWWVSDEKEWRLATIPVFSPTMKKQNEQSKEPSKDNIVNEKKVETKEGKKELVIGCSMDLSRGLRIANEQQQVGMKLALARFEKDLPMPVKLLFLDDQYDPNIALENAHRLLEQGVDIILGSSGSSTTQSFLELCKQEKLLVLFPTTGTPLIRDKSYRYMLHFRPCGCTEAKTMIQEAIMQGAKNIVIFYQNDAFGQGALSGVEQYEKEHDTKQITITKVSYNRNDVNFTQQVEQIKKASPDTFILLSTSFAAREIIRLVDISYFYGKKIFGISDLAEEAFLKFAKEKGISITTTNVVPDIHANIEIAKMYLADAQKNNHLPDPLSFEGYIITALFCDIIKQIDTSKNIKEEIVRIVESYKKYQFFGLPLTFNEAMRDLSQPVWLFNGSTWKEIPVV